MDKKILYQQLLKEEKELESTLTALRGYLKYIKQSGDDVSTGMEKSDESTEQNTYTVPKVYDKSLTVPEKILYALSKLESGTRADVAEKLLEIDPDYKGGLNKARLDAGNWCSKLSRDKNGKVKVVTPGTGRAPSVYTLK